LGVGDARYRWASKATYTDTVAFGSYSRTLVDKIGKFDESLLVNEDYDFHTRIRDSGGRIWIDPAIRATYFSRPDLRSLARQYFNYGFWKFKMLKKNPASLRWRQALPPLFVFGVLMLLLLSTFWKLARIGLAVIAALYVLILFLGAVVSGFKKRDLPLAFGVPLAIMTMHFSWGAGFWWSIFSKGSPER
jgi:GT2 family glycosyltransferase